MEYIYERIESIISNAKKSLVRGYTDETIQAKRTELEELENKAIEILEDKVVKEQQRQLHKLKFKEKKIRALEVLQNHEDKLRIQELEERIKHSTMTNENLSTTELASISKLLTSFDGTKDELQPFIANIEIIKDTLTETKHISFFNYVYKTKIANKVQTKLRQISVPTSIDTLISTLKEAYKIKKSPNVILNELTRITQVDTIRKFADKVEALTMELNEIQINSLGEEHRDVISKSNAVIAFNSFKNGLKNQDIVKTIEASRVKTLNEAIDIAIETSTDLRHNQIMFQTTQNRSNYHNNRNNRNNSYSTIRYNNCNNRNNNRNNYGSRGNYSRTDGFTEKNNFRNNNYNSNNNYRDSNNYNGNSNYRNSNSYNSTGRNNSHNNNNYYHSNRNGNNGRNSNRRTRIVYHMERDQGNSHGPETVEYRGPPEQNQ